MPRQKYPVESSIPMDPTEIKAFMEMYGYPTGFSLSPFATMRYPPAIGSRFVSNPTKLKERMIRYDAMFSGKLHDFHKMYLQHASGLLDMSSNGFLQGHPITASTNDFAAKEENDKLRKENADLRKRIEQMKSKKQI
jgi:cell division protein FtsB